MIDGEPVIGHKIANGYHGTDLQPQYRGAEACQKLWNKEIEVGSFDDLILNQLENAKKQGRKKVTILDIGSGVGNLFRDYLSKYQLGIKSRNFLAQNRDFNINMVGITDAKSVDELLTEQLITATGEEEIPDNSQIKAKNIRYTLTYNQRIGDVLKSQNIEKIDLCVSTTALTYLGPNVFENILTDTIKYLHSEGQMIAFGYFNRTPGVTRSYPSRLSLDIRDIPDIKNSSSLKATLHENRRRFFRKNVNLQDEEEELQKAEDLMVRLGIVKQEEMDERRKDFLSGPDITKDRAMALMRRAENLVMDEQKLIGKHILKLKQIKEDQLLSLFDTYKDQIEGGFKKETIFFEKK